MSITDELRKWGRATLADTSLLVRMEAIADRIDAEHERECKEQHACGVEHGIGASIDASMIQTHGYVELPKDADDVPWNVGDRDEDGNVVTQLRLTSAGWFIITDGNWPYRPKHKRHRHAPSVEDVLREFAYGLGVPVADSYVAATAAKLRLAEEDA